LALAWLDAGLRSNAPPVDLAWPLRVRAVVADALSLLDPHPDLTYFCACEFPRSGPIARTRHRAVVSGLAAALRAGRAERASGVELPAHTERVAIAGAILMLGHRGRRSEGSQLPALAPDVSCFLLVPYLGVPEAKRMAFGADGLVAALSPAR
jgi:hypothetical protein